MASLYFYQYNNYYNRQVRQEDTISDYGTPVYIETGNNLNFNPNDGVMTRYVAGRAGNPYSGNADYVIYSEDNINFTSRWFIIEQSRSLKGQYNVTLRRDVLVDYYSQILNARTFIEKATLPDSSDLIYNDEGITVNQIKTAQTPLYDDTGCGWVVGYVDRDYNHGTTEAEKNQAISFDATIIPDYTFKNLSDYTYYNFSNNSPSYQPVHSEQREEYLDLYYFYQLPGSNKQGYRVRAPYTGSLGNFSFTETSSQYSSSTLQLAEASYNVATGLSTYISQVEYNNKKSLYINGIFDTAQYNEIKREIGKTIKTDDGKYYRIKSYNASTNDYVRFTISGGKLDEYLQDALRKTNAFYSAGISTEKFEILRVCSSIGLQFEEIYDSIQYTLTMQDTRYTLSDAPYDMFCMPYKGTVKTENGLINVAMSDELALTCAQGISKALGTYCYDIQLLPYCPVPHTISSGKIVVRSDTRGYSEIKDKQTGDIKGLLLWCSTSSDSLYITKNISLENKKIENQCDMYRIVSPNFNGQYEFNVAKNGGLSGFNVDYTYLPYQPFVRVSPDFGGLYGKSFQDARGLICGGNFSVTQISDAWTNYVNNNKNYNNIFDRQIENMDTKHRYERVENIVGAATGAVSAGMKSGVIGAAASLAGSALDIGINEALYSEAVDYKRDMFGYQLDNVKAMPNSIAKTTGYNQINTIVPTLEYYTCTEEEKTAVANKIAWNGMTVMVIGSIGNYINNTWSYGGIESQGYIKGRLIRIEDVDDDFHLVNAISDELYKGAYYK